MPIFFSKMFIFDHFWSFLTIFDHFLKKFQNRYFDQKCFLIYSKSILSKKNFFFKNFFQNFHFLVIFGHFLTVFDHFWIFWVEKWKKKFYPPLRNIITNFLSHQWGLYDLRCGWRPRLNSFSSKSIWLPRYTCGNGQKSRNG